MEGFDEPIGFTRGFCRRGGPACSGRAGWAQDKRPNILFILTDDPGSTP